MEFETREHLYQLEQIIVEQESELKEVRKNLRQLQQLHDRLEQRFAELKQQASENTTSLQFLSIQLHKLQQQIAYLLKR